MIHRPTRRLLAPALALALVVGSVPSAQADEPAPTAPAAATRSAVQAAFEELGLKEGDVRAAQQKARANEMTAEEFAVFRDAYFAARDAFVAEFAKADWAAIDRTVNPELYESGLLGVGVNRLKDDPKLAAKALETFLATLPESRAVGMVTNYLPMAYVESGDLDKALSRSAELAATKSGPEQASLMVTVGDIQCAQGKSADALATFQKALEATGEPAVGRDPRAGLQAALKMRLDLLGKAAPDIDSSTWLGGEAKALSAHKGKVVVIDFWATWCPPCRDVMPGLDDLAKKHAAKGLVVLGVTREYPNGFLPKDRQHVQEGEQVRGITSEQFLPHLTEFKKRLDISYPFVVGQEADFTAYQVSGIPTLVVVDKEGKVAFLKVGGGSEVMLAKAIENLL